MMPLATATRRQLTGSIALTLIRLALPGLVDAAARVAYLGLDAYLVSGLGTDALAGLGLVLPLFLLIMTVSNAGLGLGIAGGIARALGAGNSDQAGRVAWLAVVLGLALGIVFAVLLLAGAAPLFRALGAPIICLSGMLANVFRGAGQTGLAAAGIILGEVFHAGFGGPMVTAHGMVGAAAAGVLAFAVSTSFFVVMLCAGHGVVQPTRHHWRVQRADIALVLPTGLAASANATMLQAVNLALIAISASQSAAALAGVSLAIRFETLLLPIVFAFGAGLVAMVGTNIGADQEIRAKSPTEKS